MSNERRDTEWIAPTPYKIENQNELNELVRDTHAHHVVDPVEYIADDLFELHHPDRMEDTDARTEFAADVQSQGASFGHWVHYPWQDSLVRFADPIDHYDLRTYRNRNLITKSEQSKLHLSRIAAFGLSVGSNVIDRAVQSGIGHEYMLFDYDRLSPTNLNRIQATMAQVGLLKTTIAGRKMSELDPYVKQQHFTTGYDSTTDDILRLHRPDVIVEEVDSLEVKARLRRIASELHIPVVMAGDVGDRSTLDIERHDIGAVQPFNGKLSSDEVQLLIEGILPADLKLGALIKLLGADNISQTLLHSEMLKGKELAGTPQLATAAAVGGAAATVAIREILLERTIESGTHVVDIAEYVGAPASPKITEVQQQL